MSLILEDVIKEDQIKLSHTDVKKSLEKIFQDILKEENKHFKRIALIFDSKKHPSNNYKTKLDSLKENKSKLQYNKREDFLDGNYIIENPITKSYVTIEKVA